MLMNYIKITVRKFLNDRQFSILNLIGLSTSLACAFLICLWVNDELSFDKFHEKDKQLFRVLYNLNLENEIITLEQTPAPLCDALVKEMPEVERAVSVNYFMDWFAGKGVVSHGEKNMKAQGIFASKDYFNVFSYQLLQGSKDIVLSSKNGVVISESLAKKLFNQTDDLIGKPIEWNHRMQFSEPLTISGVFKNLPSNVSNQYDIIFNYNLLLENEASAKSWTSTYSNTYLLLKHSTDIAQFNKKIENFTKLKDPANAICALFVVPFSDKYLYGNFKNGVQSGGRIEYVKLFSSIALFILLVACINFMNLSTAQSSRKSKEIGIRKALGASRKSLMFQFFGSSFLMTFLASIAAIVFVSLLLPQFNAISGKQIALDLNYKTSFSFALIVIFTAFIAGIYPAFYLSSFNPITTLKGKFEAAFGNSFMRKGLVVFQFGVSIIFVVGFFVIKKQIEFTQTKNLGYDRKNLISFKREGRFPENSAAFLSEIRNLNSVEKVTAMPKSILDGTDNQSGFSWRGQQSDESYIFKSPRISFDAIEVLGMKMVAGRSFSSAFNDDGTKIILNEAAVKKMDLKDPIGKIIKTGNFESQVIGVVNDFQYGSLHQKIEPLVFRFREEAIGENVVVKIKAGTTATSIAAIQKIYEKFHPKYTFEYSFLDEDYQKLYASEQRIGVLSNFFTALAILIACLGLFGLAAFSTEQRTKEIGIRKVLGASIAGITGLLAKDFLKLVLIAIVIASPIAYYCMNKWLADFAYRIDIQWWIFAAAGVVALSIAFLTVGGQAVKAALANPVKSLRSE
jgi:putative ABC transport system permease protein